MPNLAEMPFSRAEFLAVFATYNQAVWPAQILLVLLALTCLLLVFRDRPGARRAALVLLAGLWLWAGVVYHWLFFTRINPAAWAFGGLFVAQAGLFNVVTLRGQARAAAAPLNRGFGLLLVIYALLVYPILGALFDHAYPRAPTFGLPCPTTIFTFGVLLLIGQRLPWWLFVAPLLWAMIGSLAPLAFGIREDLGLGIAALITVVVLIARAVRLKTSAQYPRKSRSSDPSATRPGRPG